MIGSNFYSLAWLFHAVGGFGLTLVLPTVIFALGTSSHSITLHLLMTIEGFQSSAMSNVLAMPPSLLTFLLLNTLGWLVQTGRGNPFLIASLCTISLVHHDACEVADALHSGSR